MRPTKEETFMNIAELISERSTCARMKVGVLITNNDITRIVSIGYNGNYKGGPNECDSDEPGKCGCIHAEVNALIKPKIPEEQIMFSTLSPCINCAKLIINSGIKKIYYKDNYRSADGINLLKKVGVNTVIIK